MGIHAALVQLGPRLGMLLFIASEALFLYLYSEHISIWLSPQEWKSDRLGLP